MKFIVITPPEFIPDEAERIVELFDNGLDVLHLRKPGSSINDCMRLLDALPASLLGRIVTHDHHSLCRDYCLMGVHLNGRNPEPPAFLSSADRHTTVSASCHSIDEAARRKATLDYLFLSPIFDSISKQGYRAAYTPEEIEKAAADGIIDSRVMALGGISIDNVRKLRAWRFGGAAFLGDVWNKAGSTAFASHAADLAKALHAL